MLLAPSMREGTDHGTGSIPAHGSFRGPKNTSTPAFNHHSPRFREESPSSAGCTYPSIFPSSVQLWITCYREKGLAGFANATRSDKGKSRNLPEQAIKLVEGLVLQTPPCSSADRRSRTMCRSGEVTLSQIRSFPATLLGQLEWL